MAITNRDRVGKALELLRDGLAPYVQQELEAEYGSQWQTQAEYSVRGQQDRQKSDPLNDAHALLLIMWDQWNSVFRETLGHAERSLVSEIRGWRNQWAHQGPFSGDDAYRALDSIARLLTAISAPQATEVERMKQELLRLRFEEQARSQRRKAAVAPTKGGAAGGLRSWREIVTPHPDVASGRYQQAEFAADLAAVHDPGRDAGSEYQDPVEFFQRTFLTEGLRDLLNIALRRLSGQGGDPVVELQTNFGGGKTHSMLALYHLFSGVPADRLAGMEDILANLDDVDAIPKARRVALVGTALSPGQPHSAPDGTEIHTLWGELAWQLGGAEGYAMVRDADLAGVSPGANVLRQLFNRYGPALILIDEWVAFVRQTYKKHNLPAGSFDANLSFAQALTEAVKQAPTTLLVASLPASDIEIGGEGGQEALTRLKNTFGRIEATWRPASAEESFEIVRRRLFQPIADPQRFAQRDAAIAQFIRVYREQTQEFPSGCREGDYARRMKAAYPIHPELFDRLYSDWSSLEKFQRTRGVLRLMAAVIHSLWERSDGNLMILPGMLPMDDPHVRQELTRYLENSWTPIIEHDVDGPASIPLQLDRKNANLGRYSACRRVARTIFLGSAPIAKTTNPGLDERHIKLGCVQPGESVATFGDALRHLTNEATHLYVDRSRYWFSTQPSVTRLAQDRAAQIEQDKVWMEIKTRLRADRRRGELAAVHAVPESASDTPDEMEARLVILGPEYPHASREDDSPALQQARHLLAWRGNSPRLYQNMLVFLAPDKTRLDELGKSIRNYLAWKSIHAEHEILNLDAFQRNQAKTKMEQADTAVAARIKETYIWLLIPDQGDPLDPNSLTWETARLQSQEDALAERASRKLINDEHLIIEYSSLRLRLDLDRYNLWRDGDHVGIKQLWEYYARYPYLPRLRDKDVLIKAVQEGFSQLTWTDSFAYADGWDAARGRYLHLKAGQTGSVHFDDQALVVKPAAARRQLEEEAAAAASTAPGTSPAPGPDIPAGLDAGIGPGPGLATSAPPDEAKRQPRRFYGSVALDPMRAPLELSSIADEIIQHLQSLVGAQVTLTLEIEARLPDGAPDRVVRTVTENARTLKFSQFGFEEE